MESEVEVEVKNGRLDWIRSDKGKSLKGTRQRENGAGAAGRVCSMSVPPLDAVSCRECEESGCHWTVGARPAAHCSPVGGFIIQWNSQSG